MYEAMTIIVGKDMATGNYAKSYADVNLEENAEEQSISIENEGEYEETSKEKETSSSSAHKQGCQFRFGRCFVFSIGMECFSFGVFRRAVSGLYCSYIYIYIYINSTNIIQIQYKLIINYAIQTQCQTNIISKFKIFLNSQD